MKVNEKKLKQDITNLINDGARKSEMHSQTATKIMDRIGDLIEFARFERIESIFHYSVDIYKPNQRWHHTNDFTSETIGVIAQNEQYMILDNMHMTKVEKEGNGRMYPTLGEERIYMRSDGSVLGDGVFFSAYTRKRMTPPEIKAKIRNYIDKEIGYLGNLDLSIIK